MEITKEVFRELIERSMVNIYQENLRIFTDTFLRPEWSRRTNTEFSVFIDKVRAEILDDPGFRLYDWMRANGGNTPKVMALIAAAEIEKAPPVDWHQCFIKSDWIKLEYVEKYLTGLILDAKITAINRFIAEVQPAQEGPAQEEPEFFHTIQGMQKAFEAAYMASLTQKNGTWCFVGEKTHAITIFWRAAVRAGLAKPEAPVYKVVPFLSALFNVPLGKNAIDKKKKIEEYDREFQELYNKLLHLMNK